jgi:hypothetical protein
VSLCERRVTHRLVFEAVVRCRRVVVSRVKTPTDSRLVRGWCHDGGKRKGNAGVGESARVKAYRLVLGV